MLPCLRLHGALRSANMTVSSSLTRCIRPQLARATQLSRCAKRNARSQSRNLRSCRCLRSQRRRPRRRHFRRRASSVSTRTRSSECSRTSSRISGKPCDLLSRTSRARPPKPQNPSAALLASPKSFRSSCCVTTPRLEGKSLEEKKQVVMPLPQTS